MSADPSDGNAEVPIPSFGLNDAQRIARRLAPALQAHGLWIQRVHAALVCRSVEACRELASEGDLPGSLGCWFADENNEFIRRRPEYETATRQYREVHALAQGLCRRIEQARPISRSKYEDFAAAITRLDSNLEPLINELWDLLRYTDPLTGIATRYAMLPRLREEHQRVRRTGLASSVCMVDLDHFKTVNDTWGHQAGDAVLEAVSAYLVSNLRRYDQVCRYGGEEFVLMLPNTEPVQAAPIVDRLRRGLAALPVRFGDKTLHVTASFGIAPLIPDEPIGTAIERADLAMYAAKRSGRDRVRIWSSDGAETLSAAKPAFGHPQSSTMP